MSFEKEFPELYRILIQLHPLDSLSLGDVETHCLSKQKVSEAIDKAFDLNELSAPSIRKKIMLKELGLDQ